MTDIPSRRRFLAATSSAAAFGALAGLFSDRMSRNALAASPTRLTIERRAIEVLGRPASVFGIRRPDGAHGLALDPGQRFRVDLENRSEETSIIHWHGQTPPHPQDGVADAAQPLIRSGDIRGYDFAPRSGTHWMHSHTGLQEQLLMAAPLVVRTADDLRADRQEVTVLLHDFTFRDPAEVLAGLTEGMMMHNGHSGHGGMMPALPQDPHAGHAVADSVPGMAMDLNDVAYDAFLANDRTLEDPLVVRVERRGRIRLRMINGATSSAFHIDLRSLDGTVVAVDGNAVEPVSGRRFPLAMGQRLDILVDLPGESGAWPVLAQREGDRGRTGIVLATAGAAIAKIPSLAEHAAPPLGLALEERLVAIEPLADRPADVAYAVALTGGMQPYVWSLDDRAWGAHRPLTVREGQRVRIEFRNASGMAHPMHLHGHHFQVIGLDGRPVRGAVRDTVLVPPNGSVALAFDADNVGRWPLHCHNLYHMATGMMTEVVYDRIA